MNALSIFSGSFEAFPFSALWGALLLSLCSAFAFAADAAVNGLTAVHIESMLHHLKRDTKAYLAFHRLLSERPKILTRWLLIRLLFLSSATLLWFRTSLFFSPSLWAFALAVLCTFLTTGFFAELLSTFARKRAESFSVFALRGLRPFEYMVFLLAEPLSALGLHVDKKLPIRTDSDLMEKEVERVLQHGEKSGSIEEEPAEMIRNVLDFKHLTVREVMVPRRKISALEVSTPLSDVIAHVSQDGHSRYPVYRDTLDHVVGLLYVKDLFQVVNQNEVDKVSLGSLMRAPVLFAVESQSTPSMLREMRTKREHLAIVADEFGGTGGIVTMEDLLEEIVGEIDDEYDLEVPVQEISPQHYLVDASIPLSDLESQLETSFPEQDDCESLGGLLTKHFGRVPNTGEEISLASYHFRIREANEKHIVKVEIEPVVQK